MEGDRQRRMDVHREIQVMRISHREIPVCDLLAGGNSVFFFFVQSPKASNIFVLCCYLALTY